MANTNRAAIQSKRDKREKLITNIAFMTPAFLLIAVFIVYPFVHSFYLSLYRWNGVDPVKQFIGLSNWAALLEDSVFGNAFYNNILIVLGSIVIQLPFGILIAIALSEKKCFVKLNRYFVQLYPRSAFRRNSGFHERNRRGIA